jgi:hypothetical protein
MVEKELMELLNAFLSGFEGRGGSPAFADGTSQCTIIPVNT